MPLHCELGSALDSRPWKGDCVVFISRCPTRIRILFADETGLWVSYKSFAKGAIATQVEMLSSPKIKSFTQSDFAMLLEGNSYTVTKRKRVWSPRHLDSPAVSFQTSPARAYSLRALAGEP
jgi:hypothetical protein